MMSVMNISFRDFLLMCIYCEHQALYIIACFDRFSLKVFSHSEKWGKNI